MPVVSAMPTITVPFFNDRRQIQLPDWGRITLDPYQILLFVSLTEQGRKPDASPIVPALLDTGNSHCFSMGESQLEAAKTWGTTLAYFDRELTIRAYGGTRLRANPVCADVWIRDYSLINPPPMPARDVSKDTPGRLSLGQEGVACVRFEKNGGGEPTRNHRSLISEFSIIIKNMLKMKTKETYKEQDGEPLVAQRLHDRNSNRLSHPNLPLLGIRALCLNSVRLDLRCTVDGGMLSVDIP